MGSPRVILFEVIICVMQSNANDCSLQESPAKRCRLSPPDDPKKKLLNLGRRRQLVPVFGAGTTMDLFGTWDNLCPILWKAATLACQAGIALSDGHCELGAERNNHMNNIERIRSCIVNGDAFIASAISAYFDGCLAASHRNDYDLGESSTMDDWLLSTAKLRLQRLVGEAGFPFVITTNFDQCLEKSCLAFNGPFNLVANDLGESPAKTKVLTGPFYRKHLHTSVGTSTVFEQALLKQSKLQPVDSFEQRPTTPLLKIQGDLTEAGVRELIMGYNGHESSYARDILPLKRILEKGRLSCVFYGTSLEAGANWDLILNTLCSAPSIDGDVHFHITFAKKNPSKEDLDHQRKLWDKYNICTIEVNGIDAAQSLWNEICNEVSSHGKRSDI